MIALLEGTCALVDGDVLVLKVGGVGYEVRATSGAIQSAASSSGPVTLHTFTYVKEDTLQLYGFCSPAERKVFERLMSIQGVGPKVALSVVSAYGPADIHRAAQAGDMKIFQSISGIGPKVARRIVTELRDKLDDIPVEPALRPDDAPISSYYDARDALIELGMTLADAERALQQTESDASADERVRQALKQTAPLQGARS